MTKKLETFCWDDTREADLIVYLKSKPNKSEFIRELIRERYEAENDIESHETIQEPITLEAMEDLLLRVLGTMTKEQIESIPKKSKPQDRVIADKSMVLGILGMGDED